MFDFILENWFEIVKLFFFAICVLLVKGKNIDINSILEVLMKYRTSNFQDTEKVSGQNFVGLKPIYRLDKTTGNLVETGEFVDIQEMINSSIETCLENCLKRFLPDDTLEESNLEYNYSRAVDDLDAIRYATELANEYKDKLGLDPSLGVKEVFDEVGKYSQSLKGRLDLMAKKKEVKDETQKNEQKSE